MSATIDHRDLILYIRSVDVVHAALPSGDANSAILAFQGSGYYTCPGGHYTSPMGAAGTVTPMMRSAAAPVAQEKELPEAEAEALRLAWHTARRTGRTLHIVDIGRETSFHRYLTVHARHLREFPVLCRTDGRRLEGLRDFTEENLSQFLIDLPPSAPAGG